MKLKGGLYHQTQIKLAYNSNRIEGSILSEEQTRYIYETNTIAMPKEEATPVDDIIETINHFQCFDYMIDVAVSGIDGEYDQRLPSLAQIEYFRQQKRMVQGWGLQSQTEYGRRQPNRFPSKSEG